MLTPSSIIVGGVQLSIPKVQQVTTSSRVITSLGPSYQQGQIWPQLSAISVAKQGVWQPVWGWVALV